MKTNVYVDDFNLYYGAVKNTPYKWLNIRRMCEIAFPKNDIAEIHYCTPIITDAPWDPHQSTRQQMFIRALEREGGSAAHNVPRCLSPRRRSSAPLRPRRASPTVCIRRRKPRD